MTHLKNETVNKCFSLLRDYVEETSLNNRKHIAILALNQLQTITAGLGDDNSTLDDEPINCDAKPRAYVS